MRIRQDLGFPDLIPVVNDNPTPDVNKEITVDNDILVVIQDVEVTQELANEFYTEDTILQLVDAGPVFKGPQGEIGPEGPDLYHAWINQGNEGSFEDFLDVVRAGLDPGGQPIVKDYIYTQNTPSAVWNINHNLNKYPLIQCIDSAGEYFDADYKYIDANNIRITIVAPQVGTAILR